MSVPQADVPRPNRPHLIVSADPRCPGQYLRSYNPEAHGGRGSADWVTDRAEAHVYPTFLAAFEAWRQVPKSRPRRDDGRPNRPLTAFTVTFEAAPVPPADLPRPFQPPF